MSTFLDILVSLILFFETGSHCMALDDLELTTQAGLQLTDIHLPLTPEYWDQRHMSPCLATAHSRSIKYSSILIPF